MKKHQIVWIVFSILVFLSTYILVVERVLELVDIKERMSEVLKREERMRRQSKENQEKLNVYEQKYKGMKTDKKLVFSNLYEAEKYISSIIFSENLNILEVSRMEKIALTFKVSGKNTIQLIKKLEDLNIRIGYFLLTNNTLTFKVLIKVGNEKSDEKVLKRKINFNGKEYILEVNHLGEKKLRRGI